MGKDNMNSPSSASPAETLGLPEDKAASAAVLSQHCPCFAVVHVQFCCGACPGVKSKGDRFYCGQTQATTCGIW